MPACRQEFFMGSETKVGLLVGMCFIVCFAIILAHRGAPEPQHPRSAFEISTADEAAPAGQPQTTEVSPATPAAQEATRVPPQRRTPSNDLPRRRTAPPAEPTQHLAQQGTSNRRDLANDPDRFTRRTTPVPAPETVSRMAQALHQPEASAGNEVARGSGTEEQAAVMSPEYADARDTQGSSAEPWSHAGRQMIDALASAGYQLSSRVQEEQLRRQSEDRERQEIAERQRQAQAELLSAAHGAPARSEEPKRAEPEPTIRATYTVQSGDTLTRIARAQYGSDKPEILDAIFAANKDRLESPDRLLVGKDIRLPELAGTTTVADARKTDADERSPAAESDAARAFRAELAELNASQSKERTPTDRTPTDRTPAATHVVKPGETLSRIVAAHYGSADPAIIRAVFEANRKQMKSPDTIVVGTELVLPSRGRPNGDVNADTTMVADAGAARTTRSTPVAPQAEKQAKPAERWYVIQPGDLLSTVAQKELGSARRWPEIAALNKKTFPDPSHIRSGAKIRLPLDGMQTADASVVGASR